MITSNQIKKKLVKKKKFYAKFLQIKIFSNYNYLVGTKSNQIKNFRIVI